MRKVLSFAFVGVLAVETLVLGQGGDAVKVLAAAREALGGDKKLAAVLSLTATGHNAKSNGESSTSNDFDMAIALPDKFVRKDVLAVFNGMAIARTSGFNGEGLIMAVDAPQMGGGGMMVVRSAMDAAASSAGHGANAPQPSPEQVAAVRAAGVLAAKQDFARLTLGMFATSFSAYPLHFSVAGVADSPDGKADIIDVKGDGDFSAKLFLDQQTHLPLMLSWMAKEPISLGSAMNSLRAGGGGSVNTFVMGGGAGGGAAQATKMTPEDMAKMQQDLQDRMKEAQANARMVEYRVFYGDYQPVDGVKLPTKFSRAIDGKATEELTIEKYKLNAKIDAKTFDVVK
jgi:hypothetical protein